MSHTKNAKPFVLLLLLVATAVSQVSIASSLVGLLQTLDDKHFLMQSSEETRINLESHLENLANHSLSIQAKFYLHYQEALVHTGKLQNSIAVRQKLLDIARREELPALYFRQSKMLLGWAYANQARIEEAKQVLNEVIQECIKAGDFQIAFHSYLTLGDVHSGEKNFPLAFASYRKAQSILLKELLPGDSEEHEFFLQAEMNYRIGYVYRDMWRDEESIDYFKSALKFDRLTNNSKNIKYDLNQIADAYFRIGETGEADKYLAMLEAQFVKTGYQHDGRLLEFASSMIRQKVKKGEPQKAKKYVDLAASIEAEVQVVPIKIRYYRAYASYAYSIGRYEEAIAKCDMVESIVTGQSWAEARNQTLRVCAQAHYALGNFKESALLFERVHRSYLERSDHIRLMAAEVERARFDFESEALKVERLIQDNRITELALESERDKLRVLVLIISLSLLLICSLVAIVLYVSRNGKKLKFLANYDGLTGVMNRRAIIEYGEKVANSSGDLSLLLIDVDHFKSINDNYGHARGDRVLKYIGAMASDFCDKRVNFGRLGGEEFLFVAHNMTVSEVLGLARKFSETLKSKPIDGIPAPTVSIGYAYQSEGDFNALLEQADDALYQAKRRGRDCIVKYRPTLENQESSVLLRA